MWATMLSGPGRWKGSSSGDTVSLTISPLANGPAIKLLAESATKMVGAGSQLSLARSWKKPSGFWPPWPFLPAGGIFLPPGLGAGRQATCGASPSTTVTVKLQVLVFRATSTAVQVTVVTPAGKVLPAGLSQLKSSSPPQSEDDSEKMT